MFVFLKQGIKGFFSSWISSKGMVIGHFENLHYAQLKKAKFLKPKKREGLVHNSFAIRKRPRMS